jgi:MFS family permease
MSDTVIVENSQTVVPEEFRPKSDDVVGQDSQSAAYDTSPFKSRLREVLCVIILCTGSALNTMSVGAVNLALPAIGRDFGIDTAQQSYIISMYSLANGTCMLASGRIADLYGRKRVFNIGTIGFVIFTIICGLSVNNIMLIVMRVLQGFCASLLVPASSGILGSLYHNDEERKYLVFSFLGIFIAAGFMLGIFLGGLTTLIGWHWMFYILAITAAIMLVGSFFFVPKDVSIDDTSLSPEIPPVPTYKYLDFPGLFLSISGFVLLIFSLT